VNEKPNQEHTVTVGETPRVEERNLGALLASDLNTVGTSVVAGVATAGAIKRVLTSKSGGDGAGQDGGTKTGPRAEGLRGSRTRPLVLTWASTRPAGIR
jgi:hypothetical protein